MGELLLGAPRLLHERIDGERLAVGVERAALIAVLLQHGAKIAQSDVYQPADPESKQLTIVIGLDRTAAAPSPTATP